MKIFSKVIIITACVFICLGMLLGVVSVALGAHFNGWNGWIAAETMDYTETYTDVTRLSFDISAADVVIKTGTEFKIVAENVNKDNFKSSVTDGVWTIDDHWMSRFRLFSWSGWNFNDTSPKITVYLPADFTADQITLSLGAGKVSAEQLWAKDATLSVGAGDFTAEDAVLQKVDMNCGAGRIALTGSVTGDSKVKCGVGQIELLLTGDETDYNYTVDVGIGEVSINDSTYGGSSHQNIPHEGAQYDLELKCGVGQINLQIGE